MMWCDKPNKEEMDPKVSPVDISSVVYKPNKEEMDPKVSPVDISSVVFRLLLGRLVRLGHWKDSHELREHLDQEQEHEGERSSDKRRNRDERTRTNEIERREEAEGQGTEPADEHVVPAHGAGEHHADNVGGQDSLAICPGGKGT